MIEIKLSSESIAELGVHVAALNALLNTSGTGAAPAEPVKRTRAKKPETTVAVDPVPTLDTLATQQTTAESLFAETTAPAPAKEPEQKDLIAAFRVLNDKKGTDAIVALLGKFGAKTVALIPKAKWAEAIAEAGKLAA